MVLVAKVETGAYCATAADRGVPLDTALSTSGLVSRPSDHVPSSNTGTVTQLP